jgi:hypothetical protein
MSPDMGPLALLAEGDSLRSSWAAHSVRGEPLAHARGGLAARGEQLQGAMRTSTGPQ